MCLHQICKYWSWTILLQVLCYLPYTLASDTFLPHSEANRTIEYLTVEGGSNVTLTCNVDKLEKYGNGSTSNESNWTWKWKPRNEDEWKSVSSGIFLSNFSTFEETNLTLTLRNVTPLQRGLYSCYNVNNGVSLKTIEITVGYPPEKELEYENECLSNGLLTEMKCIWKQKRPTFIPTKYEAKYNLTIEHQIGRLKNEIFVNQKAICGFVNDSEIKDMFFVDSHEEYPFCTFNITLPKDAESDFAGVMVYNIRAIISNSLGSLVVNLEELPRSIVKTNPPRNLVVREIPEPAESGSSSLLVTWNSPSEVKKGILLLYTVEYRRAAPLKEEQWTITETDFSSTSCQLDHLDPRASYEVRVKATPSTKRKSYFAGPFSEYSMVVTQNTSLSASAVPFFFYSINATKLVSGEDEWKISASWPVYINHDEPGFYYEIAFNETAKKSSRSFSFYQNSGSFVVYGNSSATFAGRHCNKIGCTPYNDVHTIDLGEDVQRISNVNLTFRDEFALITWKKPTKTDVLYKCMVQLCMIHRKEVSFESIFRSSRDSKLDRPLSGDLLQLNNCQDFSMECSDVYFTMKLNVSLCFLYKADVIMSRRNSSQRILFPSHQPSYFTPDIVITPRTGFVDAKDKSDFNRFQFKTTWDINLPKLDQKQLYFSVVYSPQPGADCRNERNCSKFQTFHKPINKTSRKLSELLIHANIIEGTGYDVGLGYCCPAVPNLSQGYCVAAANVTASVHIADPFFRNLAPIISGVVVSVAVVIILVGVGHYYKKCLKLFVRKHFWPQVPVPDIYIQFFADRNKSSTRINGHAEVPIFRDRQFEISSTAPEVEVPDNIADCNAKALREKISAYNKKKDKISDERTNKPLNATESSISSHMKTSEDQSVLPQTPLQPPVFGENPAGPGGWRDLRCSGPQNHSSQSSQQRQRPHSYSGIAANSFDKAGYLREANRAANSRSLRGNFRTQDGEQLDSVTYNQLALDTEGRLQFVQIPSLCFCSETNSNPCGLFCKNKNPEREQIEATQKETEEVKLRRGKSWYERRFSPFDLTQLASPSQVGQAALSNDVQDYVGEAASYVTAPNVDSSSQIDASSFQPAENNLGAFFQLSNANPAEVFPRSSVNVIPFSSLDSHPEVPTRNCSNTNGFNDTLEKEEPMYLQEKESYVTIGEALDRGSKQFANSLNSPIKTLSNNHCNAENLSDYSTFVFDETPSSEPLLMDSAISRLLSDDPTLNNDAVDVENDFEDYDDDPYVTEAETARDSKTTRRTRTTCY